MRKFLNTADSYVADYLRGLGRAHPDVVTVDVDQRIVRRAAAAPPNKVGVVSGGGSGCEPLHTGFVGVGALDAVCVGSVFGSPVPDQIAHTTTLADSGAGVLQVVTNYPGERLNFDMAAELAADDSGVEVRTVLIADDVALDADAGPGRRALGATIAVSRLAGAAAESGRDLAAVGDVAQRTADRARSYGVALSSCTPPHRREPIFDLPEGQIELGVGISGEPGRSRGAARPACELAEVMVERVVTDLRPRPGRPLLAMLTGLGATPWSELMLLFGEIASGLDAAGMTLARQHVGDTITSLDQAGAGLTLVELDDELVRLWDAPVHTPVLRWGM